MDKIKNTPVSRIDERDSNLELFRIIVMMLIVAHHYVVNSGLTSTFGPIQSDPWALQSQIMLQIGAWGKTGINCFVLITGYFMCKSQISLFKFIKLLAEVMFYQILLGSIFMIAGYEPCTIINIIKLLIPIRDISTGFTSAFLIFYLCIPFINILINHLNEKEHIRLIVLSIMIYVIPATLPGFYVTFNYVSWFVVLYFISSYIRLHPKNIFRNQKLWAVMMCSSIVISSTSVVVCSLIGTKINKFWPYYFVADSNNFLPLITALSGFLFFKNLHIRKNKFINSVSATTFGVLLIHANSDAMRQWLWKDLLNNVNAFSQSWVFLHTAFCVTAVFVICSLADWTRIKLIELPFLKFFRKKLPQISSYFTKYEEKFLYIIGKN